MPARRTDTVATAATSRLADAGAAAVAIGGAVVVGQSTEFRGSSGLSHAALWSIGAPGVVLLVLATVPLVVWRRAPLAVFVLTAAASSFMAALGSPASVPVGATVALYFLASSRSRDRPWTIRITATVIALYGGHLAATVVGNVGSPGIAASHSGLAWLAAWFAGERSRLRREQLDELRERTSRAERDAERDRLLAVAEERVRIARDLHDSAGHAVNVIAVQAGAARLRHTREPERATAVFGAIEQLARDTVEEIDHIVAALRESDSAAARTPPGLASLDSLVSRHAAAGLDTSVITKGSPRTLTPAADNAAYRILQEALTNATRHGTGTAQVEVDFGGAAVEVTVANPTLEGKATRGGGGHGIVGMRERADMVGGTLVAERSGVQFLLRAVIPYGGHCE